MKPFIGIKKLWYGDVLSEAPTSATIKTLLAKLTEVKNSHEGTWGYENNDPEETEYKNELTGQTYYVDKTSDGTHTIKFSIGVYDFNTKAELQGGKVLETDKGWSTSSELNVIKKCVVAQTKTGYYIIFTNASITAKADTQEKNIALGVTAKSMENENAGVEAEYWFSDATE